MNKGPTKPPTPNPLRHETAVWTCTRCGITAVTKGEANNYGPPAPRPPKWIEVTSMMDIGVLCSVCAEPIVALAKSEPSKGTNIVMHFNRAETSDEAFARGLMVGAVRGRGL